MRATTLALLASMLTACMGQTEELNGEEPGSPTNPTPNPSDPFAPCVDESCCAPNEKVCTGDPDNGLVCKCYKVWDCDNPKKCEAPLLPPGDGSWSCTWSKSALTCTGGSASKPPTGSNGWTCKKNANGTFTCTASPPNPSNKPQGTTVWSCVVTNGLVVCERKDPTTPPPTTPPVTPPPSKPVENCGDGIDNDGDGLVDSKDPDCPSTPPASQCPPGKECCDGKDNNGDGRVDEGNVCGSLPGSEPCPPGAIQSCDCYCGVHRKCKPDGTWGPCKVDHNCQVAQITTHAQCGAGTYCDFGKCVPSGPSWFGAQCKTHADCPTGMVCDMQECIVDHYTHNCP